MKNSKLSHNRYSNIIPFEESVVKMQDSNGKDKYINASLINSPLDGKTFTLIGTQSPLPHTVGRFWMMAFVYNVSMIVMLCNPEVDGIDRCNDYHLRGHDDKNYKVVLKETIEPSNPDFRNQFMTRIFTITDKATQKSKDVEHIIYFNWPDFQSPEQHAIDALSHIVMRMIHVKKTHPSKPIVTHCSAGVGRSGTTQALFFMYQEVEAYKCAGTPVAEGRYSVFNIVRSLREQRNYSV